MRISLVMPPVVLERTDVDRILASIEWHFNHEGKVAFHAPASTVAAYTANMPDITFSTYIRKSVLETSDVVILVDGCPGGNRADEPQELAERRVYSVRDGARLRLENSELDTKEYPFLETHVFNRLSPRTPDGYFYYFPWGYLFRYTGWGPLDSFGYRVPEDLAHIVHRPANHKLVTVFGGSSTWSMYCLHHEMFSSRLETMLNDFCTKSGVNTRYTVLNYGMHGHTVLNQILAYTLFAEKLHPDFVISHDGYNDLGYGQLSDTYLLQRGITYQTNLEDWSTLLHGTSSDKKTQTNTPYKQINLHPAVIKAYTDRKKQFMRLAENNKARFLWGLQPFLFSKSAPSPKESLYISSELNETEGYPYNTMHKNQPSLFSMAQKKIDKMVNSNHIVDVHKYFSAFGADEHLFGDVVHTVPDGDTRIAQCYADHFINNLHVEETGLQ